jgi:hypothetical protein
LKFSQHFSGASLLEACHYSDTSAQLCNDISSVAGGIRFIDSKHHREVTMVGFFRSLKCYAAIAAVALAFGTATPPAHAETGTVRISGGSAGFIIGVGGGQGTLRFRGRTYPLSVGGMSIGTLGVAQSDLVGRAYHLRRPSDIAGTYTTIGAGVAVAGGARVARLQNANGVVLELRGQQAGLQISAGLGGLTLAMR